MRTAPVSQPWGQRGEDPVLRGPDLQKRQPPWEDLDLKRETPDPSRRKTAVHCYAVQNDTTVKAELASRTNRQGITMVVVPEQGRFCLGVGR